MKPTLRCLITEDSENDALFLVRALKEGGYDPVFERVQSAEGMRRALQEQPWDVIFCDYYMPGFTAPDAYLVYQQCRQTIPFIIVSGEIGEDVAVECLKFGADDYLLKSNLKRLVPAMKRAMIDHADRERAERAEQELAQNEERFRLMLEQVLDYAICILDLEGRVKTWNAGAEHINGYQAVEIVGQPVAKFFPPDDLAEGKPAALLAQARAQGRTVHEGWNVRKDGSQFWAHTTLTAIRDESGQLRGFTKITHDLTERRKSDEDRRVMEAQLRQAQKLEAIGQLAAGIAHEINTPTQYAEHNLRFLQESFANLKNILDHYQILFIAAQAGKVSPELIQEIQKLLAQVDPGPLLGEIPQAISEALEGTERIAKIVRAMKEFSHPGPGKDKPSPANLNQAIESTIIVARNEWKYVADMVTDLDAALPPVPIFAGEFNQVILNLIVNAAQAIGSALGEKSRQKGAITVSTRRNNGWAEIRIRDTGTGIPENIRHRIFEPFFTTKPVGKGTGQGLALARSAIVDRHKGELAFETETGKGTCFIIRLPLTPPSA